MPSVEDILPDFVLEWSLAFKTTVIVLGALLLLLSSLIRPAYPILWILPFFTGALIEWLVVATVYVEMSQMEKRIDQAKSEIEQTQSEIESTQSDIEETKSEIEGIQDDTFSFISDSQGIGATDSIEDRLSDVEDELGMGSYSNNDLESRVSDLESKLERLERDSGRRF